ncbi:HutD family protein [Arthrobacter sp. fls2-241-R2A-200]|uniref:HutD/Ves family protein n=1 Tax=Arthrobacter sp. fls2-241-R2A-200 TaxID=3040281 RepID=UPI00254F801D|nr:HutD family protein [Arthrobacter sp. fls2-241-R2A-200]
MKLIRCADIAESPWINGGGSVKVIASGVMGKDGAVNCGADNYWAWRLSIADVGQPGDFSRLPGVKRILTVVKGGPLRLTINGKPRLASALQPLAFDGSAPTTAALPRGPVKNLNLMCRTGHVGGSVSIIPLREHLLLPHQAAVLLEGEARADDQDLLGLDAVFGSKTEPTLIRGQGTLALIGLYRAVSR